jgi:hypothetical protein
MNHNIPWMAASDLGYVLSNYCGPLKMLQTLNSPLSGSLCGT